MEGILPHTFQPALDSAQANSDGPSVGGFTFHCMFLLKPTLATLVAGNWQEIVKQKVSLASGNPNSGAKTKVGSSLGNGVVIDWDVGEVTQVQNGGCHFHSKASDRHHRHCTASFGLQHVGWPALGFRMDPLEGKKVVAWKITFPLDALTLHQITCLKNT